MSQMTREECIELGASIPTASLTGWAADQLAAACGREERLERRGIPSPYLEEIQALIGAVTETQATLSRRKGLPPAGVVDAQQICEEALADWEHAKHIVRVEFGSQPDILVRCRRGVRISRLIAMLTRELDCVVSLLGGPSDQVGKAGMRRTLRRLGGVLIGKLKEAQVKLDAVCGALPPVLAEQCCQKGRLYELTRKLVRIGQLEFLHEPEQSAVFSSFVPGSPLRTVRAAVR